MITIDIRGIDKIKQSNDQKGLQKDDYCLWLEGKN